MFVSVLLAPSFCRSLSTSRERVCLSTSRLYMCSGGAGVFSMKVLFSFRIQEVAGGWMKPSGSVKMIHAERDASRSIFPFCHLQNRTFSLHFWATAAENSHNSRQLPQLSGCDQLPTFMSSSCSFHFSML